MDARKKTDNQLKALEKRLAKLYRDTQKDLQKNWDKFAKEQEKKTQKAHDELMLARASGNRKAIEKAKAEYERVIRNATLGNEKYQFLMNETTQRLANTNKIALSYINKKLDPIYIMNYNAFPSVAGYDFTLINEEVLRELVESNQLFLPKKELDPVKDALWNEKNINSQLYQGMLQGESISKIAKRMVNVSGMNLSQAIRTARTSVTSVENKGRFDSMKKASADGVIIYKRWIANHDERTRDAHRELDGQEVPYDEPFTNSIGEIMFPADPTAHPANVYNCRCGMRTVVKGFNWKNKMTTITR